eukprot:4441496-Pleurochrysis_carterae.AAC.2
MKPKLSSARDAARLSAASVASNAAASATDATNDELSSHDQRVLRAPACTRARDTHRTAR